MKLHYSIIKVFVIVIMFVLCTSQSPHKEIIYEAKQKNKNKNKSTEIDKLREQDSENAEMMKRKQEEIIESQNQVIAFIYKNKK